MDTQVIFKLGGGLSTWDAMYDNCPRSKGQGHKITKHISNKKLTNRWSYNFKFGGNYHSWGQTAWHTF